MYLQSRSWECFNLVRCMHTAYSVQSPRFYFPGSQNTLQTRNTSHSKCQYLKGQVFFLFICQRHHMHRHTEESKYRFSSLYIIYCYYSLTDKNHFLLKKETIHCGMQLPLYKQVLSFISHSCITPK